MLEMMVLIRPTLDVVAQEEIRMFQVFRGTNKTEALEGLLLVLRMLLSSLKTS